ncbi:hypothetical protein ACN38_g8767 [Penicillium nordicum]|uniref:Uncharacterized protein n=1 Tax=Penicillium nordicum TaxID=229535 RepID=A0A0N0RY80_9EURO|nr:hypothetical protein ACN38_g8767 [Penicillium nordicum]
MLQPAPGLASYKLGQKTIISEHYAQIVQAPIYIVYDMTRKYRLLRDYSMQFSTIKCLHSSKCCKHVLVKLTLHGQNATGTYLCQLVHIASSNLDPLSLYN